MSSERLKSGRFFRKVGRKKGTNQRNRASASSSSSTPPSATSPPPELKPSASSDAESSAVARIDAKARPLTIAEPTTPTSPSTATYSGDQSPNATTRAKGKGKARVGDGKVEREEERVLKNVRARAGGEEAAEEFVGAREGVDEEVRARAGGEDTADGILGGGRSMRDREREEVVLQRLSEWAAERENEREKQRKWEMDRLERERAAREADRAEREEEREERVKERGERKKERDERAEERAERARERIERKNENEDRAVERARESLERGNERAAEREERAKERAERDKEREERAKEREEARNMASLTTVDNLSSGMVGASATLVTSLLGLRPIADAGRLLRLVLGIAGAAVLGLNAAVLLAGIGSGLHSRVTPSTFGKLTIAFRIAVGVVVLLIAFAVNFLYKYLED